MNPTTQPKPADDLIQLNRDLREIAKQACWDTQALLLRSSMARIQRCLTGQYRDPAWALEMVEWVAGVRPHPPVRGENNEGKGVSFASPGTA